MSRLVRLPDRAALDQACARWLARRLQAAGRSLVFAACRGRSVGGVLAEGFFRFDDSPKPPAARVSASRALLLRSRAAALPFIGEAKRDALSAFRAGAAATGADMRRHPAALVRALPAWSISRCRPMPSSPRRRCS